MATASRRQHRDVKVLRNVPYEVYRLLVEDEANDHLRMSYHDGTLEIVSPKHLRHEIPSVRLLFLVTTAAEVLGIDYRAVGSGTCMKAGAGPFLGVGKEPDQSFYFANHRRLPTDREVDLDAGDPPPDLWIEVDNRVSSAGRLPVYAALGVPEVWQFRVKSRKVQFLRLVGNNYEVADRSLSLPILTPAFVRDALTTNHDLSDLDWIRRLRDSIGRLVADRASD
ncbi:Uma2 family endonuclease [Tundrisphaera sp. TA3]|uniref:Uma2 family endonuclease n=1 Tax=Tundrisphaera sp. TA3 TaxID=3435775 RepID=UPI003EBC2024